MLGPVLLERARIDLVESVIDLLDELSNLVGVDVVGLADLGFQLLVLLVQALSLFHGGLPVLLSDLALEQLDAGILNGVAATSVLEFAVSLGPQLPSSVDHLAAVSRVLSKDGIQSILELLLKLLGAFPFTLDDALGDSVSSHGFTSVGLVVEEQPHH